MDNYIFMIFFFADLFFLQYIYIIYVINKHKTPNC